MTVAERIDAEELLREALRQFAGEWVAVVNHVVVAHAPTLEQLVEQPGTQEDGAEVFQVADNDFACFY
jgi:hypothetical protein